MSKKISKVQDIEQDERKQLISLAMQDMSDEYRIDLCLFPTEINKKLKYLILDSKKLIYAIIYQDDETVEYNWNEATIVSVRFRKAGGWKKQTSINWAFSYNFIPRQNSWSGQYIKVDSVQFSMLEDVYKIEDQFNVEKLLKLNDMIDKEFELDIAGDELRKYIHNNVVKTVYPDWSSIKQEDLPSEAYAYVSKDNNNMVYPHHWLHKSGDRTTMYLHPMGVVKAYHKLISLSDSDINEESKKEAFEHIENHRTELKKKFGKKYVQFESLMLAKIDKERVTIIEKLDDNTEIEFEDNGVNKQDENDEFEVNVKIVKVDNGKDKTDPQQASKRLVYGVVYGPDDVDSQSHFMKSEEIETMAHRFMQGLQFGYGGIDTMHNFKAGSGFVVESFIARNDEKLKGKTLWSKGSWVLVTKIFDDDIWDKIQKGEIAAYSLAGSADVGEEREFEMEGAEI